MPGPMSPQEIQELTAGYVLGDLTSAEAETFTTLLAEMPELAAEVAALQETLAMMPYGLNEASPPVELRSQILTAAQAELNELAPTVLKKTRQFPKNIVWIMGTLATGAAVLYGLATVRLNHQLRLLQAQNPPALITAEGVAAEGGGIQQTWSGLSQLLQDHQRSINNPEGPVDFVVQQPTDLPTLVKGFHTTVAALPLLPSKQGMLLGASNCQLGDTPGLRLTYQLATDETVSAYQIALADEAFPEFQAAQLTLQQSNGTGVVLWRDDNYLYALVAEMPTAKLQSLAYAITGT